MKSAPPAPHPVLVVDDDEMSLLLVCDALRRVGLDRVLTCRDSRRVAELLARQPVEILFLDLAMPHVGGEELLGIVSRNYPQT